MVCRVLGPLLILGGIVMIAVGIYSFSTRFDQPLPFFGERRSEPNRFWMVFLGMFALMPGLWLTGIGYMGTAARYVAEATAPAAREIMGAVAAGMRGNAEERVVVRCHKCEAENDADAKFCKACGAALEKSVTCPACNEKNDPDAKFCDNCGGKLK